jgi:hypothetical protein
MLEALTDTIRSLVPYNSDVGSASWMRHPDMSQISLTLPPLLPISTFEKPFGMRSLTRCILKADGEGAVCTVTRQPKLSSCTEGVTASFFSTAYKNK